VHTAAAAKAAVLLLLLLLLLPGAGRRTLALPLGEHDGVYRQEVDGAITRELRR